MAIPNEPLTRVEQYLNNIAVGEGTIPEEPLTRTEQYLDYIAKNGGGGSGGDPEAIASAVTDWLEENVDPVGSAVVVDSSLSIAGAAADAAAVGTLKSAITDVKALMPAASVTGSNVSHGAEKIKDVLLNGATFGAYDGMVVIDGDTTKITGMNGQLGDYNKFVIYITGKANGIENFVCDWLTTAAGSGETVHGRGDNTMLEIKLLQTRCEYTVAAANAYFTEHPLTVWYKTTNNGTATKFYQIVTATYDTTKVFRIGTAEAVTDLSAGDYIDFGAKKIVRSGVASSVAVVNDVADIPNNATISGSASVTVATLIDVGDALDNKIDADGWNEVAPVNTTFFDGVNYFDINKTTVYNNRFVDWAGQIKSSSNVTSIVFPVKPDTTYWFYASGMNRFYVVETSEDNFSLGQTYTVLYSSSKSTPTEFTTGHTARYVFAYIANYTYDFTQNNPVLNEKQYNGTNNPYVSPDYLPRDMINPLSDANVLIFGDSITETCRFTINAQDETTAMTWNNPSNSYVNAGGTTVTYSMWPKMLRDLGVCTEVRNYARAGASYKDAIRTEGEERRNLSYQITVALNDLDNPNNVFSVNDFVPDIVIFALGTNDGAPNDTYSDAMAKTVLKSDGYSIDTTATLAALDKSKFCEAARYAFLKTRIAFPNAQFYCVLPIQRANNETNGGELNTELRKMAERYGCVIVNGFAESGIIRDTNVWNALGETLKDGLHPNDKGQNILFRAIYGALMSHYVVTDTMNP